MSNARDALRQGVPLDQVLREFNITHQADRGSLELVAGQVALSHAQHALLRGVPLDQVLLQFNITHEDDRWNLELLAAQVALVRGGAR